MNAPSQGKAREMMGAFLCNVHHLLAAVDGVLLEEWGRYDIGP